MGNDSEAIRVLDDQRRLVTVEGLPNLALKANRLPAAYADLYIQLYNNAISEFPPIEGYETVHSVMVERLAWFFVQQKIEDGKDADLDIDFKVYRQNFNAMSRICETLIREAKAISIEQVFKFKFAMQVSQLVDRCVSSSEERKILATELMKLAAAN